MFNGGAWGEFLIIVIAALILIKPQDFPALLKKIARLLLQLRRYKYQIQNYYFDALHEVEREEVMKQSEKDRTSQDLF